MLNELFLRCEAFNTKFYNKGLQQQKLTKKLLMIHVKVSVVVSRRKVISKGVLTSEVKLLFFFFLNSLSIDWVKDYQLKQHKYRFVCQCLFLLTPHHVTTTCT